jgi:large subunit ribosomal protein L18
MKIDKKRRRQYKTNYSKRLALLKGDSPRLVIRKTNRYMIIQIVESKNAQDNIRYGVSTKELIKYGWPEEKSGSLKSLSASYLGGFLLGKKAKDINRAILDMGLIPNTKGSRVYSTIKGASDAGLKINFDKKILPNEEAIKKNMPQFDKILEAIKKK